MHFCIANETLATDRNRVGFLLPRRYRQALCKRGNQIVRTDCSTKLEMIVNLFPVGTGRRAMGMQRRMIPNAFSKGLLHAADLLQSLLADIAPGLQPGVVRKITHALNGSGDLGELFDDGEPLCLSFQSDHSAAKEAGTAMPLQSPARTSRAHSNSLEGAGDQTVASVGDGPRLPSATASPRSATAQSRSAALASPRPRPAYLAEPTFAEDLFTPIQFAQRLRSLMQDAEESRGALAVARKTASKESERASAAEGEVEAVRLALSELNDRHRELQRRAREAADQSSEDWARARQAEEDMGALRGKLSASDAARRVLQTAAI